MGVPTAIKHAVLTLVECGGQSRSFHVDGTKVSDAMPIIRANISAEAHVMADEAGQYTRLGKFFTEHDFARHSAGKYGRGEAHTNAVEDFYSVFKRGMKGVYQHCREQHLHRYVAEFDFRYNARTALGVDDETRTLKALRGVEGKGLTYRRIGNQASV